MVERVAQNNLKYKIGGVLIIVKTYIEKVYMRKLIFTFFKRRL